MSVHKLTSYLLTGIRERGVSCVRSDLRKVGAELRFREGRRKTISPISGDPDAWYLSLVHHPFRDEWVNGRLATPRLKIGPKCSGARLCPGGKRGEGISRLVCMGSVQPDLLGPITGFTR